MGYKGGFSGRTNKLVDRCYSFWQGRATAVLVGWLGEEDGDSDCEGDGKGDSEGDGKGGGETRGRRSPMFDKVMLQRYILLCAHDVNGAAEFLPQLLQPEWAQRLAARPRALVAVGLAVDDARARRGGRRGRGGGGWGEPFQGHELQRRGKDETGDQDPGGTSEFHALLMITMMSCWRLGDMLKKIDDGILPNSVD